MMKMEGRLIKKERKEEFGKQFQNNIDRGVFRCLSEEELKVYKGPINYITTVEAYKTGPYATTP
jgi:hypothetical protein